MQWAVLAVAVMVITILEVFVTAQQTLAVAGVLGL
jgi:hypothetical protein